MSATVTPLTVPGIYRIEVTAEHLEELKSLIALGQTHLQRSILESEKNERFWLEQTDDVQQQLAVCQQNLATARKSLSDTTALVPFVYGAKFIPIRRRPK